MSTTAPSADGSRAPQGSFLHNFLSAEFPSYLSDRLDEGRPPFMLRDVNAFLGCGDIKRSKATLECFDCKARWDFPLSCKVRSFCAPCAVRRQQDRAPFLGNHVFGAMPVRHWTLTSPFPLRVDMGYDPGLVTEVVACKMDAIFRFIRWKVKRAEGLDSVDQVHPGSMTVTHRVSSNLDPNVHFHSLVTDGAFVERPGEPLAFVELPPPTDAEVADVAWDICRRVRNLLERRGVWFDIPDTRDLPKAHRSVSGVLTLRDRFTKCRFTGVAARHEDELPVGQSAFNLCARDGVRRGDAENLQQLIAYLLSPPLNDDNLHRSDDGRVVLELKRPRFDGTQTWSFSTPEFLNRLAFLPPPPRVNLVRFHGILAPHAKLRAEAVPDSGGDDAPPDDEEMTDDTEAWAELKTHSFGEDMMNCRICGGRLRLMAVRSKRIDYRRGFGIRRDLS